MDPVITKILEGIPYAGMGSTLERNALIGYVRNLINQDKYTVEMILSMCESAGYQRQMAEDIFKELTGLSPKLIVNNNEYYKMPNGVPNMCIAWGNSKSTKDKAYFLVPFEYGYATMETDGINAPIPTVISATIPEAFEELKKVAKNIQTLDKIITKKLLETENIQTIAKEPNQTQLPYSSSPLQILKKNFKDKVLSVSEFERQASKLLASEEITVNEAEDLMAWKQDLIDEDESYANEVLQLDEDWNQIQATVEFEDIWQQTKEMANNDDDFIGFKNDAKIKFEANKDLFKNVDLIEGATRLYQLLLGFSADEILGHSKVEKKMDKKSFLIHQEKGIRDFQPWSGAKDTWKHIIEQGKADEFDSLIEELYPDGIDETKLNDLLWFDADWIYQTLGMKNPYEDEEEIDASLNKKASKKVMAYSENQINQAIENGHAYDLLADRIITRQDEELFKKAVNKAIEEGYGYKLLINKIITKENKELFNKAVNKAIEEGYGGYYLLIYKIITRQDGELFNKVVNKILEDNKYYKDEDFNIVYDLLIKRIITKQDGELFNRAVNQVEKSRYTFTKKHEELFKEVVDKMIEDKEIDKLKDLLENGEITEEDGELFNRVVNQVANQIIENSHDNGRAIYKLLTNRMFTLDEELFNRAVNKLLEQGTFYYIYHLLDNRIITKEDGELFNRAVDKLFAAGYGFDLLKDKIITKEDGERFNKIIERAIKINYDDYIYKLFDKKIITNQDGELFNKAIYELIENGKNSNFTYNLLKNEIVTRQNGELFNRVVDDAIKNGHGYNLLTKEIITKEDGDLFNRLVDKAIEEGYAYDLLTDEIITKQNNKELFNKAVNKAIENGYGYNLLINKIITKEDGELFKKAVDRTLNLGYDYVYNLLTNEIITKEDGDLFNRLVDKAIEEGWGYALLKHGVDIGDDKELFHKKQSSKKVTAENMTLEDIEAEDNKDKVQEEIQKIEEKPIEEIFSETTPEQYLDEALAEDKVDTINEVVSKCIDKFSEKFKDFSKYTVKILSYNTKVLGDYKPVQEEIVQDKEINANAILQVILSISNNADESNIKKALVVFSITNGELHWTGTVRGENDQVVAFTEEGLDALFEVNEPSEEELEDII